MIFYALNIFYHLAYEVRRGRSWKTDKTTSIHSFNSHNRSFSMSSTFWVHFCHCHCLWSFNISNASRIFHIYFSSAHIRYHHWPMHTWYKSEIRLISRQSQKLYALRSRATNRRHITNAIVSHSHELILLRFCFSSHIFIIRFYFSSHRSSTLPSPVS